MNMINLDDDEILLLKFKKIVESKKILQKQLDDLKVDYEAALKEVELLRDEFNEYRMKDIISEERNKIPVEVTARL